jgi:hypothetical protein
VSIAIGPRRTKGGDHSPPFLLTMLGAYGASLHRNHHVHDMWHTKIKHTFANEQLSHLDTVALLDEIGKAMVDIGDSYSACHVMLGWTRQ